MNCSTVHEKRTRFEKEETICNSCPEYKLHESVGFDLNYKITLKIKLIHFKMEIGNIAD